MVFIQELRTLDRIFKKILQSHWKSWCRCRPIFFTIYFSNRRFVRQLFECSVPYSAKGEDALQVHAFLLRQPFLTFRVGLLFPSQLVCPRLSKIPIANKGEKKCALRTLVKILTEVPWRVTIRTVVAKQDRSEYPAPSPNSTIPSSLSAPQMKLSLWELLCSSQDSVFVF